MGFLRGIKKLIVKAISPKTLGKFGGTLGKILKGIFGGGQSEQIEFPTFTIPDEEPKEENSALEEADLIIENFKDFINSMIDDDYALKYSHSFNPKPGGGSASGADAKQWSAEQLVGYGDQIGGILKNAIEARGKEAVAKSIQDNGEYLQELAEQLVFAIYESKYAKWGGGRGAYTAALTTALYNVLISGSIESITPFEDWEAETYGLGDHYIEDEEFYE